MEGSKAPISITSTWSAEFDRDPAVIYELDQDFRIKRCNRAWDLFALENNGHAAMAAKVSGTFLFDVIPQDLRPFYHQAFHEVEAGSEWSHMFECSSAAVIRRLRMTIQRFGSGYLTRNTLIEESLAPPPEGDSRDIPAYGPVVTMCAHCRRVRNNKEQVWQWIPDFVARTPRNLNQTLCPACYAYYYPQLSAKSADRSA
jgi:hypothetical protein